MMWDVYKSGIKKSIFQWAFISLYQRKMIVILIQLSVGNALPEVTLFIEEFIKNVNFTL